MKNRSILAAGAVSVGEFCSWGEQPFPPGAGGSETFRIPAIITLADGTVLAACDARWTGTKDYGGLDTIAAVSNDGGKTWQRSFPLLFPDSRSFTDKGLSTTIIDPVLVQTASGDVLIAVDVNPSGITTQDIMPGIGTGLLKIGGTLRLVLTDKHSNASILPTEQDTETYAYYVGDYNDSGFAPILCRASGAPTGFAIDGWFNLYTANGEEYLADLMQTQVDSSEKVQQNIFYKDSCFHVYNTGYVCVIRSTDSGKSWGAPKIINHQIKPLSDEEVALLMSPGRGMIACDDTVIFPLYRSGSKQEQSSLIYSADNGNTWVRSNGVTGVWSSESEAIPVNGGAVRLFFRNNTGFLCYADAAQENGVYAFGEYVLTEVEICSNCNLSAIRYYDEASCKDYVLVACPGVVGRLDGVILAFELGADNSLGFINRFAFNKGFFAYSCITRLPNGNIGILWEYEDAAIRFDEISIDEILKRS